MNEQADKKQLSELDTLSISVDAKTRKYLLELLDYKKQIQEQLKIDNDVLYQQQLKDALEIIDNNINRVRFDGIL